MYVCNNLSMYLEPLTTFNNHFSLMFGATTISYVKIWTHPIDSQPFISMDVSGPMYIKYNRFLYILPSLKLTASLPLKIDAWNTRTGFLLGRVTSSPVDFCWQDRCRQPWVLLDHFPW